MELFFLFFLLRLVDGPHCREEFGLLRESLQNRLSLYLLCANFWCSVRNSPYLYVSVLDFGIHFGIRGIRSSLTLACRACFTEADYISFYRKNQYKPTDVGCLFVTVVHNGSTYCQTSISASFALTFCVSPLFPCFSLLFLLDLSFSLVCFSSNSGYITFKKRIP